MELIIVLIILRILYSVLQSFQGGGKKPQPPQRHPRRSPGGPPLFPWDSGEAQQGEKHKKIGERFPDIPAELQGWGEEQTKQPAARPAPSSSFAGEENLPLRPAAVRTPVPAFLAADMSLPRGSSLRRRQAVDLQKREETPAPLFDRENLIRGMIALEVLSPPRARKPWSLNHSGTFSRHNRII